MNRLSQFCGCLVASFTLISTNAAQESVEVAAAAAVEAGSGVYTEAEIAEQRARVRQLQARLREERRQLRLSRRGQIQARLEKLTDEERAALRVRRRMQDQARLRRQPRWPVHQ